MGDITVGEADQIQESPKKKKSQSWPELPWMSVDKSLKLKDVEFSSDGDSFLNDPIASDDLAFLQYTSGFAIDSFLFEGDLIIRLDMEECKKSLCKREERIFWWSKKIRGANHHTTSNL